MRARAGGHSLSLRVAGSVLVSAVLFSEGACGSGRPGSSSLSASQLEAYESARIRAWDPSRRFKALFKAEVSPKVGAVGRGYVSMWWDGPSGSLEWRASAPIAGAGKAGILRMKDGEGAPAGERALPLSGRLSPPDLIACILGTPDAPASRATVLDEQGRVVEMRFARGEVVSLEPGTGVPRRIEASGPDGRAILTLESYGPWPAGEEVPPL